MSEVVPRPCTYGNIIIPSEILEPVHGHVVSYLEGGSSRRRVKRIRVQSKGRKVERKSICKQESEAEGGIQRSLNKKGGSRRAGANHGSVELFLWKTPLTCGANVSG